MGKLRQGLPKFTQQVSVSYPFDSSEKFHVCTATWDLDLHELYDWFRMRFRARLGLRCALVWGLHSEYAGNRPQS